jgi:hypothetical protein
LGFERKVHHHFAGATLDLSILKMVKYLFDFFRQFSVIQQAAGKLAK